ncbi:hypothetical protein [Streptomyces dysideae]|uniref:Uncharacterized protein n=1 Tax=Streptomyces dysideae TaxID=909626 RepID=A0A101URZ2_9ACTN|nr:hypothetical protein [Streptomyces dysideae]KUO15788.1 hypothetical protein AQJ91_39440 [Streptomyces dysideae]
MLCGGIGRGRVGLVRRVRGRHPEGTGEELPYLTRPGIGSTPTRTAARPGVGRGRRAARPPWALNSPSLLFRPSPPLLLTGRTQRLAHDIGGTAPVGVTGGPCLITRPVRFIGFRT